MPRLAQATVLVLLCALLRLAQATAISGHVTDSLTHQPVANASVRIFVPLSPAPPDALSTLTDANGYYEGDVTPGSYQLRVGAQSYLDLDTPIEIDGVAVVADFSLSQPASISGTVLSQGVAVPYAEVLLLNGDDGSVQGGVEADADGSYMLQQLAPGTYAVCVIDPTDAFIDACYDGFDIPASGIRSFTPLALPSGGSIASVDFDLHAGSTIAGTVYDRYTSFPVTQTSLDVVLYSTTQNIVATVSTSVDENGAYSIGGIAAGQYYVRAGVPFDFGQPDVYYTPALYGGGDCTDTAPCPFAEATLFDVPAHGAASAIDFQLRPGHRISGHVKDAETGIGLAGVEVRACEWIGLIFESAEASTAADGSYALDHVVGPGAVGVSTMNLLGYADELWPNLPLYSDYGCPLAGSDVTFTAVDQDLPDVDFALDKSGTISGHAPRIADNTWATVVIVDANTLSQVWTGTTDENQDYSSGALPSGEYYAAVYFNDGQDCRVYAGYTCSAPDGYPQVDADHATPILLQPGQNLGGIDLPATQLIFADGFDVQH